MLVFIPYIKGIKCTIYRSSSIPTVCSEIYIIEYFIQSFISIINHSNTERFKLSKEHIIIPIKVMP